MKDEYQNLHMNPEMLGSSNGETFCADISINPDPDFDEEIDKTIDKLLAFKFDKVENQDAITELSKNQRKKQNKAKRREKKQEREEKLLEYDILQMLVEEEVKMMEKAGYPLYQSIFLLNQLNEIDKRLRILCLEPGTQIDLYPMPAAFRDILRELFWLYDLKNKLNGRNNKKYFVVYSCSNSSFRVTQEKSLSLEDLKRIPIPLHGFSRTLVDLIERFHKKHTKTIETDYSNRDIDFSFKSIKFIASSPFSSSNRKASKSKNKSEGKVNPKFQDETYSRHSESSVSEKDAKEQFGPKDELDKTDDVPFAKLLKNEIDYMKESKLPLFLNTLILEKLNEIDDDLRLICHSPGSEMTISQFQTKFRTMVVDLIDCYCLNRVQEGNENKCIKIISTNDSYSFFSNEKPLTKEETDIIPALLAKFSPTLSRLIQKYHTKYVKSIARDSNEFSKYSSFKDLEFIKSSLDIKNKIQNHGADHFNNLPCSEINTDVLEAHSLLEFERFKGLLKKEISVMIDKSLALFRSSFILNQLKDIDNELRKLCLSPDRKLSLYGMPKELLSLVERLVTLYSLKGSLLETQDCYDLIISWTKESQDIVNKEAIINFSNIEYSLQLSHELSPTLIRLIVELHKEDIRNISVLDDTLVENNVYKEITFIDNNICTIDELNSLNATLHHKKYKHQDINKANLRSKLFSSGPLNFALVYKEKEAKHSHGDILFKNAPKIGEGNVGFKLLSKMGYKAENSQPSSKEDRDNGIIQVKHRSFRTGLGYTPDNT